MNTRLYMFPEFLDNKPVDRLLGDGLIAEDFNDDALGRALDAIHEYGTNQLFSEIACPIAIEQKRRIKDSNATDLIFYFIVISLSIFNWC